MSDKKKTKNYVKSVDFTNLLPKMLIEKVKLDPLYEKAFLDRNEKTEGKFNQNTTTWD